MFRKANEGAIEKSKELERKYHADQERLEKLWGAFETQEKALREARETIKTLEDLLEYQKKVSDRVAFEWLTREKELLVLMDEIDVQKRSETDIDPDLKACLVSLLQERKRSNTVSQMMKELNTELQERTKALKKLEERKLSETPKAAVDDGEITESIPEFNQRDRTYTFGDWTGSFSEGTGNSEHMDSLEQDLKKAREKMAQLEGAQERDRITREYMNDKLKKREIELENLLRKKTGSEDFIIKDGMTFEKCLIALKDVKEENKELHSKIMKLMDDIVKYYEKEKDLKKKYETKEEELKEKFEKRMEDLQMEVEYLKEMQRKENL